MLNRTLGLGMVLVLAACGGESPEPPATAGTETPAPESTEVAEETPKAKLGDWGVETQYIDESVDPGDDFYSYANAGWVDSAEYPPGYTRFGSFQAVGVDTEKQVDAIVQDILSMDWPKGSPQGNIKALYQSYMNMALREELGVEPIRPELDAIFAAKSHEDIARIMAGPFATAFPRIGVSLDDGDPERYVLFAIQASTTLPQEFYLTQGEPYEPYVSAYRSYLEKILGLAGVDDPEGRAKAVVNLETRLAEASWTNTQKRDKLKMYHPMSMEEFLEFAPGAQWEVRIEAAAYGDRDFVVVYTDTAVQKQAAIFAETPVEVLQSYEAANLISNAASSLSSEFNAAHFDFFDKTLSGATEQRPLGQRAIGELNGMYGEPLGKLYVERYFPDSSKEEIESMIGYMQDALRVRLSELEWMDDETRAGAINKLDNITVNVGYPDRWRDFSSLEYESDDLVGNSRQYIEFEFADMVAKLDKPNQRWEWLTQPQVINAFYAGIYNSITFPAAIMQPPFFDPNADPAVNFGAFGAAIGHEIGHGFDDQGSTSDANGLQRNWWSDKSREEFNRRTDQLVAQYDQYSPMEGVKVNGRLTLGENIGDLAGITVAYAAWKGFEKENYEGGVAPVIDGFTGDQRFFMGFAQLWRNIATDQEIRRLALTDNHSPGEFRANGIVRNFDPWYAAFSVTEDNDLYLPPDERVRIW